MFENLAIDGLLFLCYMAIVRLISNHYFLEIISSGYTNNCFLLDAKNLYITIIVRLVTKLVYKTNSM